MNITVREILETDYLKAYELINFKDADANFY